ncbi:MAG: hypothetical protein HN509_04095 [Halobacteriovoraceae bacterium]|jgi:hypothetical protein|nr:hypothetical protein [Halobacteriovoraceae bacterium]MBT5093881.1 hypothetical protein [Halobacteriovoraceae bacterium]
MKYLKIGIMSLLLASCSSGPLVASKDTCEIKKHYKDNVFQVLINGKAISKHWYVHPEAVMVARELARQNECMP